MKRICRWLPLAMLPCLLGCHATLVTVGHREQDLRPVQNAQNRTQMERVLGSPLWHPGATTGLTYEVYQFEAGRSARPFTGTMEFCLDAVTLGYTEALYGDTDLPPTYKVLAVAYDANNRVRFVSPSWLAKGPQPAWRMMSSVPDSSGVPKDVKPLPLIHWTGTNESEAMLELPWYDRWGALFDMVHVTVDGRKTKGSLTSLAPGSHEVTFDMDYIVFSEKIEVLPRRVYRLNIERYRRNYWADITWIEDVQSREVLCCRRTFPPRP
jgi:hypothetical protein